MRKHFKVRAVIRPDYSAYKIRCAVTSRTEQPSIQLHGYSLPTWTGMGEKIQ